MATSEHAQADLMDYTAGVTEKKITTTAVCKLETSRRKNDLVRSAIDEWQGVASMMANYLPSFPSYAWGNRNNQMKVLARRNCDNIDIYAHDRNTAVDKVREAFASWDSNGRGENSPKGEFGDGDYMSVCSCCSRLDIVENDRGYGLKVNLLKSADPLWFHISAGEYQREYLRRVCDGNAKTGGVELRLDSDAGDLYAHLPVSWTVDVYKPADITRWVGVDRGMNTLYAAAVVESDDDVVAVDIQTGNEYFHHRSRIEQKKDELQRKGSLKKAKAQGLYKRYTDQMIHECSRAVVDLADKHRPCGIALEDLTYAREDSGGKFHEFPYGMMHEKISYKAKERGIPVKDVNPHNTSIECRKCGQGDDANREWGDATAFQCRRCGYEVHADVNAAINIAKRAN